MRATGFNFIRKPPEEKVKNNKALGPGHYNPTNSLTFKKCLNYTFKKYKPDCTFQQQAKRKQWVPAANKYDKLEDGYNSMSRTIPTVSGRRRLG